MRITDKMRYQAPGQQIRRLNSRRATVNEQITTGRRLLRPSDDPTAMLKSNRLQSEDARLVQFERNQDAALARLSKVDGILSEAANGLFRIKELTINGLTSVVNPDDLNTIAGEIEEITEHLSTLMNTRGEDGSYLFGGLRTDQPPYLPQPPYTFQGDTNVMQLEVSRTVRIDVSVPGGGAMGDGTAATVDAFANLVTISTEMRAAAAIGQQPGWEVPIEDELAVLETAISQAVDVRAKAGMKMERLESVRTMRLFFEERVQADKARQTDADIPDAISELTLVENALQATLAASSRTLSSSSLLDYLS